VPTRKKIVRVVNDYFKNKPVFKVYLFGSVVRNESDVNSDIDLLVELDRSKPIGLEFIQMQLDLNVLLAHRIDLVTEESLSKHIRPYVEKEKELIYEKKNI